MGILGLVVSVDDVRCWPPTNVDCWPTDAYQRHKRSPSPKTPFSNPPASPLPLGTGDSRRRANIWPKGLGAGKGPGGGQGTGKGKGEPGEARHTKPHLPHCWTRPNHVKLCQSVELCYPRLEMSPRHQSRTWLRVSHKAQRRCKLNKTCWRLVYQVSHTSTPNVKMKP